MSAPVDQLVLPAEAFEEYMLADDRPQYPMSIHIRLRFTGEIQRQPWEQAWGAALERHPLLRARLRPHRGLGGLFKHWRWESTDSAPSFIWVEGDDATEKWPHTPFLDLGEGPGVRAWVQKGNGESSVTFHLHHASVDGVGTMSFLRDWMHLYHLACGQEMRGKGRALKEYAPAKLADRGSFGLTLRSWLQMLPAQLTGLVGAVEFLFHRTGPLISATASKIPAQISPDFPAAVTTELSADQFTKLRAVAKEARVTVNDLLLRDMFLAVKAWRDEHGIAESAPYIRLSVPMNLRETKDRDVSACNIVSMVFLDRKTEELQDSQKLLRTISDQMQLIKNRRLGLTLIFALRVTRWIWGGIPMMTKAGDCRCTTVLSNLGEPFSRMDLPQVDDELVVGNLRLKEMNALAPLRPLTQASFVVNIYAGRLGIAMHFDSHQVTAEQAKALLDAYVKQLRITCGDSQE